MLVVYTDTRTTQINTSFKMIKFKKFKDWPFFSLILAVTGYILFYTVDWKLALAIFLVHWHINIEVDSK